MSHLVCPVLYCTVLYCRFVSHLVCPVFHERTVEAEVEIIQCEHEKNKHSDVWRLNQVLGSRGICQDCVVNEGNIFCTLENIFYSRENIYFLMGIKT